MQASDYIIQYRQAFFDSATIERNRLVMRYLLQNAFCPWCCIRFINWTHIGLCAEEPAIVYATVHGLAELPVPTELSSTCLCNGCAGVLPYCTREVFKDRILAFIKGSGFEIEQYLLLLTVPASLTIRDAAILHELFGCGANLPTGALCSGIIPAETLITEPFSPQEFISTYEIIPVKRLAKYILGPYITPRLGVPVSATSFFRCEIVFTVPGVSITLTDSLQRTLNNGKRPRLSRKRREESAPDAIYQTTFSNIYNTRRADHFLIVSDLLNGEFPPRFGKLTTADDISYTLNLNRDPIYIAGRYIKLQRGIPQSGNEEGQDGAADHNAPNTSVAAILAPFFKKTADCVDTIFHAAGREDIDVRMVGTGRPFLIELTQCKNGFTRDWMALARSINNDPETSAYLRLDGPYLYPFEKNGKEIVASLDSGSGEKRKNYRALCWSEQPLTPQLTDRISGIENLEITQSTPIRVLHRRTNMLRKRLIYSISIVKSLDEHFFVIDLSTQAGTYIKEFVNSDLGRTQPSLRSIISETLAIPRTDRVPKCEILQLDVKTVEMEWPPADLLAKSLP